MDAASDDRSGIFADEPRGKRNAETGQTKSSHLLSSDLPMNAGCDEEKPSPAQDHRAEIRGG